MPSPAQPTLLYEGWLSLPTTPHLISPLTPHEPLAAAGAPLQHSVLSYAFSGVFHFLFQVSLLILSS